MKAGGEEEREKWRTAEAVSGRGSSDDRRRDKTRRLGVTQRKIRQDRGRRRTARQAKGEDGRGRGAENGAAAESGAGAVEVRVFCELCILHNV